MDRIRTDFLFATHSSISGLARTLDLGGTFDEYIRGPDVEIADARAFYSDWAITGYDSISYRQIVERKPQWSLQTRPTTTTAHFSNASG